MVSDEHKNREYRNEHLETHCQNANGKLWFSAARKNLDVNLLNKLN